MLAVTKFMTHVVESFIYHSLFPETIITIFIA